MKSRKNAWQEPPLAGEIYKAEEASRGVLRFLVIVVLGVVVATALAAGVWSAFPRMAPERPPMEEGGAQ